MDSLTQEFPDDPSSAQVGSSRRYPLNCWWVAASVEQVGASPLARTMLQQRLVLFRTRDGKPCALLDRCPHRWTPLSLGKIVQDEIVCPYHGFRFDVGGACTYVPTERRPPKVLRVRSYPTRDHGPFVWVWMGDPAKADPALLPAIGPSNEATELRIAGYRPINCEYTGIHENLADSEHPFYLHRDAFENHKLSLVKHRMSGVMDVASRHITFLSRCDDVPPTNFESLLLGVDKSHGIDIAMTSVFTIPGCFSVEVTCKNRASSPVGPSHVKGRYLWCSTPITETSCHFWWVLTYDSAHGGHEQITEIWNKAIQEDIDVLEAIQASMNWNTNGAREMLVSADRPVVAIRRIVAKTLEAEASPQQ